MTVHEALKEMGSKSLSKENEDRRWELLSIVLREMFLANGVDIDLEIEPDDHK